nr:UTRA domain-containing protein [Acidimicrobium ferrooxidans]
MTALRSEAIPRTSVRRYDSRSRRSRTGRPARRAGYDDDARPGLPCIQRGLAPCDRSLRCLRGAHPIALERALVPTVLAPSLDAVFDPSRDPLSAALEHHFGLAETHEEQWLVARPPQGQERGVLGLARSEWVIDIEGVAYAASRQPFDAFSLILRAHTFELHLRSSADGRLISYSPAAT